MIHFLPSFPRDRRRAVLALGVFDAVHRGHCGLVRRTVEVARRKDALCLAVTFFPHPREVLFSEPPILLLPPEKRIELLLKAGCDAVGVIDFTPGLAKQSPETFCRALLSEKSFELAGLVVGSNWRFGAGGQGTVSGLVSFFKERDVDVVAVQEETYDSKVIGASRIRNEIAAGNLDRAAAMLGRRPALFGRVVRGFGDAAKTLFAPTVNLAVDFGVMPPDGVYAGVAELADGKRFKSAVNIGSAPTFGGRGTRVEAHLLDFTGSLYDQKIDLELFSFVRSEKKFASVGELKTQIARDLEICRAKEME